MVARSIGVSIRALRVNSARQLKHLVGIETNTANLYQMKKDINSMKSAIDDINDKGIEMRR